MPSKQPLARESLNAEATATMPRAQKRVLIISPVPTHPMTAGNRARVHALLEALETFGVDFHFAFITWESADASAMQRRWGEHRISVVSQRCTPRHPALWRRIRNRTLRTLRLERYHPSEVDCYRSPGLKRAIEDVGRKFRPDCVMVEYVFNSWMLELFPPAVRKLIDTHDKFAGRYEKFLKAGIQPVWFSTTRSQERRGLRRADCILAIQEQEAVYFRKLTGRDVITLGHITTIVSTPNPKTEIPTVLFVGANNVANQDAVSYCLKVIWPMIRSQLPTARLLVAGRICESISSAEPGVEHCGLVPEIASIYAQAHVVINPVRAGTGLKIKSVEALAHGRPLVTTPAGSLGIEVGAGHAFLVGKDAQSLAGNCLLLLRDPQLRSALAAEAIRFMNDRNQMNYQALKLALGIAN